MFIARFIIFLVYFFNSETLNLCRSYVSTKRGITEFRKQHFHPIATKHKKTVQTSRVSKLVQKTFFVYSHVNECTIGIV